MSKNDARITINCNSIQRDHDINPFIFGHFVEDIRDHMDAMLAFVLRNMDFEQDDHNQDGVSGNWYPVNYGKNTTYAVEPAARLHSGHSQRITIQSRDQAYGGIAQKIAMRGNVKHNLRLYARASMEITDVLVEIRDLETDEVLAKERIKIDSHDWKEYETTLSIPQDCNRAEFRIGISSEGKSWHDLLGKGNLWIDHISLIPEDSVGIVKKQVFEMTENLNSGMMRLGGNEISGYHWQDYVGSPYLRPSKVSEAWGMWTNKYFGTDEFIKFCQDLNVEPLICVNAGSGTPEEAAQWVEYCNGSVDTPMGALRAENGHPEPYNVKYWEIGNEVWGPWQIGHCSAEEFAKIYVEFAKAMKEADPSIKLLACGDRNMDWNRPMLEIAGEYMDYLTLHIYHGYNWLGLTKDAPRQQRYEGIVAFPEVTRHILESTRELLNSKPEYKQIKLAITEWNTMYLPNTVRSGMPNEHTLEAAVANAGVLNEFLRQSDLVEIGSFSDLVNGWLGGCIRVGDNYADQSGGRVPGWACKDLVIYGTPTYYVLKNYANRDIDYVVTSQVDCDTFKVSTPKLEDIAGATEAELPILDVVTCINKENNRLTAFVVNRSLENQKAIITLEGFKHGGQVKVWEVTGSDIDDLNDVFDPAKITTTYAEISTEADVEYELKGHSSYVFEIEGNLSE